MQDEHQIFCGLICLSFISAVEFLYCILELSGSLQSTLLSVQKPRSFLCLSAQMNYAVDIPSLRHLLMGPTIW